MTIKDEIGMVGIRMQNNSLSRLQCSTILPIRLEMKGTMSELCQKCRTSRNVQSQGGSGQRSIHGSVLQVWTQQTGTQRSC